MTGTVTSIAPSSRFVSQEEIKEQYAALAPEFGGHLEDYFGVVFLSKKFKISPREAASFVALEGSTNAGFDAYYHDVEKKSLRLYVFKWSEDHMSFKNSLEEFGCSGIIKIFFDTDISKDDHPVLVALKKVLFERWREIDQAIIDFVFNGDPVNAEQSKVLGFLRETVEDRRGFIQSNLGRVGEQDTSHDLVFRYVSNVKALGTASSSRATVDYNFNFDNFLSTTKAMNNAGLESRFIAGKNQMKVIFLSLADLHRMYSDLGERFFEKNLRSGLGEGKMTNLQIRNTLSRIIKGEEEADNFTFFHNGITLTAQILEDDGKSSIRMVEPRILNGAQTVRILRQFVEQEQADLKSETEIQNFDQKLQETKILTRIMHTKDERLLREITISNNRQNPIMPWNLRANDLTQISLEEHFAKLGIYYERRENAYKNLLQDQDNAYAATADPEKGVIEIRKFAQTLLAMQGRVDRMSELKEIFENERWYHDTFKSQYLEIDPRQLVLLYKVHFRLPSAMREIKAKTDENQGYVARARNLIHSLCIQGLLNDPKFDRYVESYGNSVSIEAGITEILKRLSHLKIQQILSDAFKDNRYQEQIRKGSFSFLLSKTTFGNCMNAADRRFKWKKKSL